MEKYYKVMYKDSANSFYNLLEDYLVNNKKEFIVTANPETFMKSLEDKEVTKLLSDKNTLLVPDGIGIVKSSKMLGYDKGRFSFNVKGGRCEACQGDGILRISMHFLPDVYVPCDQCQGKRYNEETLQVHYKGKTIADVLDMTVEEALEFFSNVSKIKHKLQTLNDVGLSYIKLGQSATTLSGGEAQRVKLASELQKKATGKTLFVLDEPTTGLHSDDVKKLIEVLQRLVEHGDTVLVIEHNLDVIKCADQIVDMGPEGGQGGGTVICTGTPEKVAKCKESYTGQYLKPLLEKGVSHGKSNCS